MTFDLFPDVPITFKIGTERVEFGPHAYAQAFSRQTRAEWEAEMCDRSRRPYLMTIRGKDGLIRAEWTQYATDPVSAIRDTAATAQCNYGEEMIVTARLQTRQEGWV